MTSLPQNNDLPELKAALAASMADVVFRLALETGRAVDRKGRALRIRDAGGLEIEITGLKQGLWHCHAENKGGGPLDLVMHLAGCSFAEAIEWARAFTGTGNPAVPAPRRQAQVPIAAQDRNQQEAAERARKTEWALELWDGSVALAGTLGERYLVETRRIPRPVAGWPDAIRFQPEKRALIVALTTDQGAVQAVQMIFLDHHAQKEGRGPGGIAKQSIGYQAGAALRLPGPCGSPVLFAEGPETGLSVWRATGYETVIAFGSMSKLPLPAIRRVIFCQDDDKPGSPADRKLIETIKAWRAAGADVSTATPWPERKGNSSDFNDALRQGGLDSVRARIAAAMTPAFTPRKRLSIEVARLALAGAVDEFFAVATGFEGGEGITPPVHAIKADVGTGKSDVARRRAARLLTRMRAAGDKRNIVFAVPTHKLGNEQAKAFNILSEAEQAQAFNALPEAKRAGLHAAVWRGRGAIDPDAGQDQNGKPLKMCRDLEAVADAQSVLADPEKTVCKQGEIACQFYGVCGYQRQKRAKADLWIAPHEVIFSRKPKALGDLAALIVDESAWQAGLTGAQGHPTQITLDQLRGDCTVPARGNGREALDRAEIDTAHLGALRATALRVLSALSEGALPVEAFRSSETPSMFTPAEMAVARAIEQSRKIEAAIKPGMTAAERKAIIGQCQKNRFIHRLLMFWRALEHLFADGGPSLSGHAEIVIGQTDDGQAKMVRLKGRKQVTEGFQVPTLIIDATMQIDLVKPYWPQVVMTAEIEAETPHMRIIQTADKTFAKSSLIPRINVGQKQVKTCDNNLSDLHATLGAIGRKYAPEKILVVAQKDVEDKLRSKGRLPANIQLEHHNNIAGRDEWRDVPALVVIGRTQPPSSSAERIAEALTGCAIDPLGSNYPKVATEREMASGLRIEADTYQHPDPVAEAVRWSICEAELVQIIGRGRGVNRTAAKPLDVIVLTDVVLPLPIELMISASDLAPSPFDRQMAAGGIAFESPSAASVAYPELWPSANAARMAFARATQAAEPHKRHIEGIYGECAHLDRIEYQPVGARRSPAVAWYDPAIIRDPRIALEAMIGPLAKFELHISQTVTQDGAGAREAAPLAELLPMDSPRLNLPIFSEWEGAPPELQQEAWLAAVFLSEVWRTIRSG